MQIARIGTTSYPIFDGTGAQKIGGRWNSVGVAMIYASRNISCARLERLAHVPLGPSARAIFITVPNEITIPKIDIRNLAANWQKTPHDETRAIGDKWTKSKSSLLLEVPSVASPLDFNILINPLHPDFVRLQTTKELEINW